MQGARVCCVPAAPVHGVAEVSRLGVLVAPALEALQTQEEQSSPVRSDSGVARRIGA